MYEDENLKTPPLIRWKEKQFKTPERNDALRKVQLKERWTLQTCLQRKVYKRPNFLSPIDRIRIGINRRAEILGFNNYLERSFEGNQSFPKISRPNLRRYEFKQGTKSQLKNRNMERIRVDGSNGVRFSAHPPKGGFVPGVSSPYNTSLLTSASESFSRIPKSGINPNKAVFTIDSKSSRILIVNHNASQLLGYSTKELCRMQFTDLLTNKNRSHVSALSEGHLNSEDGTMVLLSGKVVEMNTKMKSKVAVSLWIRQIDQDGRCLAVAEPVERRVCQLVLDKNGYIVQADYDSLLIFQFESVDQLIGLDITVLIPAIILPDSDSSLLPKFIRKQKATGKTTDGVSFPLCLLISQNDNETDTTDSGVSNQNNNLYHLTIWVFQNLSGLLVVNEYGIIESCNHHFSMLMFGYPQFKILNQHITLLIPNFGQEQEYLERTHSRNATESSFGIEESETETDAAYIDQVNLPKHLNKSNFNQLAKNMYIDKETKINSDETKSSLGNKSNILFSKSASEIVLTPEISINEDIEKKSTINSFRPTEIRRHSMIITNACNIDTQRTFLNENDLLTPVNEPKNEFNTSDDLSPIATSNSGIENKFSSYNKTNTDSCHGLSDISNQNVVSSGENIFFKNILEPSSLYTSTPDVRKFSVATTMPHRLYSLNDGKYKGEAIHADGNILDILYTISSQILPCGRKIYCVWVCRDPYVVYDTDDGARHQNLTLTFNSFASTVENSLGHAIKITAAQNSSRPNSVSLISQCEEDQIYGEFSKNYTTLKQIGKGAYGYVKMAYRNSDRLLVVAKFILKEKLCSQFMVLTEDKKEIPMEIYLLTTVKHPNIVTVYDVFENDKFFQLVMEKHGSGMDLFEFIDRQPLIDEKLGCFIFRQIANAVYYLHSLNILHRDIKDENIIIDHNFHVKLIDFGSATFMEEGKLFSTFFGTTEYCSPEVLAGNKYAGPELEIWSLGVTLYVLMFFENPFVDVEETLRAQLDIPHKVSKNLENLLFGMLDKNPKTRFTMRQLMSAPWINQEINSMQFNFAYIVPCEPYEANPEKYYIGQMCSSATTVLSTVSPQDSLSLVDEDSMIDGEEVEEDNDLKTTKHPQYVEICDNFDNMSTIEKQAFSSQLSNRINSIKIEARDIPSTCDTILSSSPKSTTLAGSTKSTNTRSPNTSVLTNEKGELDMDNKANTSYEILNIEYNNDGPYEYDSWDDDYDDEEDSFS